MYLEATLNHLAHFWKYGGILGFSRTLRAYRVIRRTLAKIPGALQVMRTTRPVLPECLAILGLLGMIWLSTAVILVREHSHDDNEARGIVAALSDAFGETTVRIVSEIDQTLLSVRASYAQLGPDFDIQRWARNQLRNDQFRVQIAMMDRDGDVVKSTLERSNRGKINIADRPHFKYHLDPLIDELYISDPVVGRGSAMRTIQFSRKLLDNEGAFSGVVVLSISVAELSRFYGTIGPREGTVTVFNERNVAIASAGTSSDTLNQTEAVALPAVRAERERPGFFGSNSLWSTPTGGLVRRTTLKRYPLTVVMTKSYDQIYEGYRNTVRNFFVVGLIATFVVSILGTFWIMQRRRVMKSSLALSATLAGITQGVAMIDMQGRLSVINQRARSLLRLPAHTPAASDVRSALDDLIKASSPSVAEKPATTDLPEVGCQILDAARNDGQVIEIRITELLGGGMVHTLTDITEQHKAQSRIRHLAHHDILTGLPNRVLLSERIASALDLAVSTGHMVMVIFIDLDGFKGVNDTLGHLLGDRLLMHVAEVIKMTIGPFDFVARLGGDEFTVIRSEVKEVGESLQLAPLLIDRIAVPVVIDGHELRVSASIGVSVFPRDGLDYHVLFKNADIALYRAKNEGRATYRIFAPGMDERLHRRMMLEEDLRNALATGTLEVYYQPQSETDSRRIVGFEALVRWEHPRLGWISPAVLVSVAEECGIINKLGAFVLEQACQEAAAWPSNYYVSVNVSSIQLLDVGFVGSVRSVLMKTGLPARRLELELTESVMTDNGGQAMAALSALREIHIKLALDDFGTGYSSLSNLLRLHFDKVKIDQSFIREQHQDSKARAIVEAILVMSQHIGLTVTAEGVETEEQLAMLRSQGCPLVQGYLLGWPISGKKTLALLLESHEQREDAEQLVH